MEALEQVTVHEQSIKIRTLDSFGLAPDAMKLDVEEHEIEVLKDSVDTILRSHPMMVIESGPDSENIRLFLSGYGYSRFLYDPKSAKLVKSGLRKLSGNMVFLTDAHYDIACELDIVET